MKIRTPIPKFIKSFLIKVIMSSVIIGIPPNLISYLSFVYFFWIILTCSISLLIWLLCFSYKSLYVCFFIKYSSLKLESILYFLENSSRFILAISRLSLSSISICMAVVFASLLITKSLYTGLVSISVLAISRLISSLNIFGTLFINSVSGLLELLIKGILTIDVTDWTFLNLLISSVIILI